MSSVASSFPDALDGWRWDGRDRCSSPEVLMMDLHRYSCSPPYFEPPITPMFIPLKTEDLGVSAGRIGWELLLGPPKESEKGLLRCPAPAFEEMALKPACTRSAFSSEVPPKTKSVCVNSAVGLSVLVQEETQVPPLQEMEKQTCGRAASAAPTKDELINTKRKTQVHRSLMKTAKPELKIIKTRWRELRALGYLKNYPNSLSGYILTLGTDGVILGGAVTPEELQLGAITATWLTRYGGKLMLKKMVDYTKSSTEAICRAAAEAFVEEAAMEESENASMSSH